MKKEIDLSKKLIKYYKEYGYIERIEPQNISAGIPDILITNKKKYPIFIELKLLNKEFKNKKIPLRTSQVIWFLKYPSKAFILIQIADEYYIFEKKYAKILKNGLSFEKFQKNSIFNSQDIDDICDWFYNNT